MSEEMEEIIARITAENKQAYKDTNIPVSEEEMRSINGFRQGFNGSFAEMCEDLGIDDNIEDGPIFGPTD